MKLTVWLEQTARVAGEPGRAARKKGKNAAACDEVDPRRVDPHASKQRRPPCLGATRTRPTPRGRAEPGLHPPRRTVAQSPNPGSRVERRRTTSRKLARRDPRNGVFLKRGVRRRTARLLVTVLAGMRPRSKGPQTRSSCTPDERSPRYLGAMRFRGGPGGPRQAAIAAWRSSAELPWRWPEGWMRVCEVAIEDLA